PAGAWARSVLASSPVLSSALRSPALRSSMRLRRRWSMWLRHRLRPTTLRRRLTDRATVDLRSRCRRSNATSAGYRDYGMPAQCAGIFVSAGCARFGIRRSRPFAQIDETRAAELLHELLHRQIDRHAPRPGRVVEPAQPVRAPFVDDSHCLTFL